MEREQKESEKEKIGLNFAKCSRSAIECLDS